MDFEAAKAVCLSFPGATQDLKWGEVTVFSVGGKMFACTNADLPARRISFKGGDDRCLELTDRPGIIPAPYMARLKRSEERRVGTECLRTCRSRRRPSH